MGVPVIGGAGLVRPGKTFFVDGSIGSDGNSGVDLAQPLKTVSKAYSLCTSNNGDVIYVVAADTGVSETGTLTLDKNYVSIIGLDAPNPAWSFARINMGADYTPAVLISGQRNYIRGIRFGHGRGNAANLINVSVTGAFNVLEGCHLAGPFNAAEAGANGYRDLTMTNSDNVFKYCTFGIDNIGITATDYAHVQFLTGASREIFEDCYFVKWAPNAGAPAGMDDVLIATGPALGRWAVFNRCVFITFVSNWTAKAVGAINSGAGTAGIVLLKDCTFMNYTDVFSTGTARIHIDGAAPTTTTSGLAVAVA